MTTIKVAGRWHEVEGFTGAGMVETDHINAVNTWLMKRHNKLPKLIYKEVGCNPVGIHLSK